MDQIFDWLGLLLVVAIFFLALRPGSQGPVMVEKIGDTLMGLVGAVTGGGGWWRP